jgi:hypothetical protein
MSNNQTATGGQHDAELTALLDSLDPGTSKHERAILGIHACIASGINKGPEIIATLSRLGFNALHVGKLLHDHRGSDPARHEWERLASGVYEGHELAE